MMKNLKGKTALVTGASSGIGEAFIYQLAEAGVNLIITARSEQKLVEISDTIKKTFPVNVTFLPQDLAKKGGAENLFNTITEMGITVDLLINNAGFGKWTHFLDESILSYEEMIELNIISLTTLSHLFLPAMLAKKEGGIINVASTGSFQPCPYITTYCATKAFVLSFSEGLYGEYFNKGITVTALCPGNTQTGFQATANADTTGMRADTPETVAKEGLKALLAGKSYHVVGKDNYATSLLPRFLPRKTTIKLVSKMMSKRMQKAL